jgi:predicted GH43/DUF377 family glycosyl hydrolase
MLNFVANSWKMKEKNAETHLLMRRMGIPRGEGVGWGSRVVKVSDGSRAVKVSDRDPAW